MEESRSVVKAVAEIVLNVLDLPRMQTFYQTVLGFRFHSHFPDAEPTIVFLTIRNEDTPLSRGNHPQLFALIDARRHIFTKDTYQGIDHPRSSLNHLAFEIDLDDYPTEQERLRGLGIETRTMTFPQMSARALFFQDPEGNQLELICHDPTAKGEEVYTVGEP